MGCGSSTDDSINAQPTQEKSISAQPTEEKSLRSNDEGRSVCRRREKKKYKKPAFLKTTDTFWKGKRQLVPDYEAFTILDAYAINAPAFLKRDHQKLINYLTQLAKSDVEKARVIFRWIIENVAYDMDNYLAGNLKNVDVTPKGVIRTGKTVCSGYSNLFKYMCNMAGLECEVLTGASKGRSFKPGHTFPVGNDGLPDMKRNPSSHAWNKVKLEGDWFLCDATWADLEYTESKETNDRIARGLRESDFLADPDAFLSTHFPMEDGISLVYEQYVENPMSDINRWASQMTRMSGFFVFEMSLLSTDKCVLVADDDNHVTIQLRAPHPMRFWGALSHFSRPKDFGDKYSMIHTLYDMVSVELFLPKSGEYLFKLCASPTNADEQLSARGYILLLQCKVIGTSTKMNKPLVSNNVWGQNLEFLEAGFEVLDQDSPIIISENGKLSITLELPPTFKSEDLGYTLKHESNTKLNDDTCVYAERGDDRTAIFHLRLPEVGDYAFALTVESKAGKWISGAGYLVRCLECSATGEAKFPDGNRSLWGPNGALYNMGINPTEGPSSTIKASDGQCSLTLKYRDINFTCDLAAGGSEAPLESSKQMIFVDKNTKEDTARFHVRIPKRGYYRLNLFASKAGERAYAAFIGRWLIDVVSPFEGELYPSHGSIWGPNEKFSELGLRMLNNDSCSFVARGGRCEIRVQNSEAIERCYHLKRNDQIVSSECIYEESQVDGNVTYHLKLHEKGFYKFEFFGRKKGDTAHEYLGSWLIENDSPYDGELFPLRSSWGPGTNFFDLGMGITNPRSTTLEASGGRCKLVLTTARPLKTKHRLERMGRTYTKSDGARVVDSSSSDRIIFEMNVPETGYFAFLLFAKEPESSKFDYVGTWLIDSQ